jgi:sugar transferase (PEP-CTERM/EpsH1 system associated)
MTVAHVVLGLQVGGLERVVVNLACKLKLAGFRTMVVCLEQGGPLANELQDAGIPVHVLAKHPGLDWAAVRRLAELLKENAVQVVHTHNPQPHLHCVLAAFRSRTPVCVHTKHGRNYPHMQARVLLNRALSWRTDAIVPVSDNARDVALQCEKVNPHKLHRIWNGVDTDRYRPDVRGRGSEVRGTVIGTVARLSPEKDQKTMLAAFQLVHEQVPGARLVFAGDGPSMTELRRSAADMGIAGQVDFLGTRTDIPDVLLGFTLFTLSSITEGISMTILEAMACGLPVVATDVGGNREIVNPPECGLIVPARDPQALANAYLELLRDPNRRAEMGAAAQRRVEQHFSLDMMVKEYQELYEMLLRKKGVIA